MKDFNEAKKAYESVSVPEELNDRVQAGIRQGKRNRSRHVWSRSLGTAAASLPPWLPRQQMSLFWADCSRF